MVPAPFAVILDANVLFSAPLRDTLLRAAAEGLFQARWSKHILDEVQRNLIAKTGKPAAKIARLRAEMTRNFSDALVEGYEPFIQDMRNDVDDRHVAAAAVKCGAQVIVTHNLRDFGELPDGIEAQSPDEFLCNLFDLDPRKMVDLLREQAADLRAPPVSFDELLERLRRVTPELITLVTAHLEAE